MWVTVWLIGLSYTKTTFIRTGDMCVNEPELCRSILQTGAELQSSMFIVKFS
jgi:hypothetical protein